MKHFTNLRWLIMSLLLAVGASAWGDETVTLTQSNLGLTGSYTSNTEKTIDGITYVYTDLMKNTDNIQAKASSGVIYNKTAYSGNIKSVKVTHSGTARSTTIHGSSDGENWTQVATGSGTITADFTNKGYKYFKITRGSNAAYWTKIEVSYEGGSILENSDLAITGTPVALSFDLYNNSAAQTVSFTTSSTGEVSVSGAEAYVTTSLSGKTITVTPKAVTPSTQTITISQAADATYKAGTVTFTVDVTDSTPFSGGDITFIAGTDCGTTTSNNSADAMTKSVVTISGTDAALATAQYRFYQGSDITFSTTQGKITKIQFVNDSSYPLSRLSTSSGTWNNNSTGIWIGSASSVSFHASQQVRTSQIIVTISIDSSKEDPTFAWSAATATATVGTTPTLPTLTNTSDGTVTYSSSNTDVAIIDGSGNVTILAAGETTITASVAATSNFNSASASYTLTVNAGSTPSGDTYTGDWIASEQGFTSGAQVTSPSAIDTNVSVSFTSNGNGSKYYDNGSAVRVYGGNSFTIVGVEGVTITEITITFGASDGSNIITTNTGTYDSGLWTGSNNSVTFSVASGNGNRRIAAISVTYTKEGGSDLLAADLKFQGSANYNHTMEVGDIWDAGFTQATDATVTFTFEPIGVATYNSATGKVTAVTAGTTLLTATSPETSAYEAGTATLNITVNKKPHGLAYETNSYTITVGDAFNTPTLTNPNSLTVTYSGNNDNLATVDSQTGALTFVSGATGNITVTASTEGNDTYAAGTASYTLRVLPEASGSTTFTKVTSTNDLEVGEEYLIVFEGDNDKPAQALAAISTTSTKYGTAYDVTITSNTITITNQPVAILTLGQNGNNYTFKSSLNNEYLYWGSGNTLNTDATVSNNTSWTITVDNGAVSILNVENNARKLQYNYNNGSNQRFACYATEQTAIALYKKGAVGGPYTVTIGSTGYATLYYGSSPLVIPEGVTAYTLHTKDVNGYTDVELGMTLNQGDKIAAGTGVILTGAQGEHLFPFDFSNVENNDNDNILMGSDVATRFDESGYEYFVLGKKGDDVGFYHMTGTNGGKFVNNGAHKAFLRLPEGTSVLNDKTSSAAMRGGFSLDEMIATAIERHEQEVKKDNIFYNLAGQRVLYPTKGIYIVNGKKVLIK